MDTTGSLNQPTYLHQQTGTARDESGAVIPVIVCTGPIWAAVNFKETGSDERHLADQNTAITAVNFTIRNSPERTISAKDQIEYRGRLYAIRSVLEADAKRCFLLIEARQIGEYNTA